VRFSQQRTGPPGGGPVYFIGTRSRTRPSPYGTEAKKASVGPSATGGDPGCMKNGSNVIPFVVIPM